MISLSQLEAAALGWVGTPYADNGCQAGLAASCHGLCWALYQEAGWDHGIELGDGPSRWAGRMTGSPLCEFMARQSGFLVLEARLEETGPVRPADMLGFRVGAHVSHAALALGGGRMVHALRHGGVQIRNLNDPTWACRLEVLWRPREPILP